MSLYAWINLLSISIPLIASFHPKIRLYQYWHRLLLTMVISMAPYILWDIYFTNQGYWGFNLDYLSGVFFLGLPLEEWLFFISIPYACVFTHVAILVIKNDLILSLKSTSIITFILLSIFIMTGAANYQLAYTFTDMLLATVVLIFVYAYDRQLLRSYYITFLFMLIPFFLVNGVLTGSGIANEVVWYSDDENLGIRLLTIPIEDTVYAFSLILLNLFMFTNLNNFFQKCNTYHENKRF